VPKGRTGVLSEFRSRGMIGEALTSNNRPTDQLTGNDHFFYNMKIREIYTVVRDYETNNLEEERGHMLHVLDDTGEFLYGGGDDEQLSVQFQIDKGEGWVNFDPEQ